LGVWVKIFYRGTTQYDALEVSQFGINKERILARQRYAELDLGKGIYTTKSLITAKIFAELHGAFGRAGGPGILEIRISRLRFWHTKRLYGIIEDVTISNMPGHFQTFFPLEAIEYLNKHAKFRFYHGGW